MCEGRIFIISGPSGSGKDTVLSKLFEALKEIKFSISRSSILENCSGVFAILNKDFVTILTLASVH